jgi:phage-related protein
MSEWSVRFYSDANEKSPVTEWFESQDPKVQAKLLWIFELLEESGIDVGMPHVKPLGDKLYEVRARVDKNAYRVVYFLHTGQQFIMLHGFQKKTQETPKKDMKLAQKYLADFLSRVVEDLNS